MTEVTCFKEERKEWMLLMLGEKQRRHENKNKTVFNHPYLINIDMATVGEDGGLSSEDFT